MSELSPEEAAIVERFARAPDALVEDLQDEVAAALAAHAPHVGPVSGSWTCPLPCNARSTNGDLRVGTLTSRSERAAEHRAHLADALLPLIAQREAAARGEERERVAQAIEALRPDAAMPSSLSYKVGREDAARIARGDA